ncbi:type II toxin-antitoxin system VapC family toxin [Desulfosarcina sp. OttesenSCG-928-G10]|nr:type II toxin-antitoxin system VapC family toxin [Desulfosarcina sp. OttesenSCG-928-G10]MDL2322303.1 type II toxin-antitoxin system VapC family toxin [Desulfosarcina sp. OttesenSCG-928-B08]
MKTYMLDTNICAFIMRERPAAVIERLEKAVKARSLIVVSAITYAEMRYGAINPKAPKRIERMVNEFIRRLDAVLPWDAEAIDRTVEIRKALATRGTPIGENDAAIAGHALASNSILVTNNTREFCRVDGLQIVDWSCG